MYRNLFIHILSINSIDPDSLNFSVVFHFVELLFELLRHLCFLTALAQDDEGEDNDASTDELCLNRPADEYFRLSTEGDCREVVR